MEAIRHHGRAQGEESQATLAIRTRETSGGLPVVCSSPLPAGRPPQSAESGHTSGRGAAGAFVEWLQPFYAGVPQLVEGHSSQAVEQCIEIQDWGRKRVAGPRPAPARKVKIPQTRLLESLEGHTSVDDHGNFAVPGRGHHAVADVRGDVVCPLGDAGRVPWRGLAGDQLDFARTFADDG